MAVIDSGVARPPCARRSDSTRSGSGCMFCSGACVTTCCPCASAVAWFPEWCWTCSSTLPNSRAVALRSNAASVLLRSVRALCSHGWRPFRAFSQWAAVVLSVPHGQMYMERFTDLLSAEPEEHRPKLLVREDPRRGVFVEYLTKVRTVLVHHHCCTWL